MYSRVMPKLNVQILTNKDSRLSSNIRVTLRHISLEDLKFNHPRALGRGREQVARTRCRVARKKLTCWARRLPAPAAPRTVSPAVPGGPQPQLPPRQRGRARCCLPLEPCCHCREAHPIRRRGAPSCSGQAARVTAKPSGALQVELLAAAAQAHCGLRPHTTLRGARRFPASHGVACLALCDKWAVVARLLKSARIHMHHALACNQASEGARVPTCRAARQGRAGGWPLPAAGPERQVAWRWARCAPPRPRSRRAHPRGAQPPHLPTPRDPARPASHRAPSAASCPAMCAPS